MAATTRSRKTNHSSKSNSKIPASAQLTTSKPKPNAGYAAGCTQAAADTQQTRTPDPQKLARKRRRYKSAGNEHNGTFPNQTDVETPSPRFQHNSQSTAVDSVASPSEEVSTRFSKRKKTDTRPVVVQNQRSLDLATANGTPLQEQHLPEVAPVTSPEPSEPDALNQVSSSANSAIFKSKRRSGSSLKALSGYLKEELHVEKTITDAQRVPGEGAAESVAEFIVTPFRLERTLMLGAFLCADVVLHAITVMPCRVVATFFHLIRSYFSGGLSKGARPHPAVVSDCLRLALALINLYVFSGLDIGSWYHNIRGQAQFKLYVIFSVLEILDRLMCSFGGDIFDSLVASTYRSIDAIQSKGLGRGAQWTTRKSFSRWSVDFAATLIYLTSHSLIIFSQIVTLNVAINSSNNSLLTLLISNNFVEIKASIFKKFSAENLFQLCGSDIVERFNLAMFLFLAVLQNLRNNTWTISESWIWEWIGIVSLVYGAEIVIDWTKHAFIVKFNGIDSSIYQSFKNNLYDDILKPRLNSQVTENHADLTQLVGHRIGFMGLPIACMFLRILFGTVPLPSSASSLAEWSLFVGTWLCILLLKVLLSINLQGRACERKGYVSRHSLDAEEPPPVPVSDNIQRFKIYNKNIPF